MSNSDRLTDWHRLHRRGLNRLSLVPGSVPYDAPAPIQDAVYHYLLRSLSKGFVPDPQIVAAAFEGRREVPPCGILECTAPEPHTH